MKNNNRVPSPIRKHRKVACVHDLPLFGKSEQLVPRWKFLKKLGPEVYEQETEIKSEVQSATPKKHKKGSLKLTDERLNNIKSPTFMTL